MKVSAIILFLSLLTAHSIKSNPHPSENLILGKWITKQKNLVVEIYKQKEQFRAKIVWFDDRDDPARPMDTRLDSNNPNESLRRRKLIGMDILKDLKYNPETKRWENGLIYDPLSGREWSSVVYFDDDGNLKVKGYWKFEFISKTLTFTRLERPV